MAIKYNGENVLTYLLTLLKPKLNAKVDKVEGKGLSTNDFTTELMNKLNGIEAEANKYSHPTHTAASSGFYKVTVDSLGHVTKVTAVTKSDITGLGIPGQDTTYTHPSDGPSGGATSGLYKITVNDKGHVTAVTAVTKNDITGLGIPGSQPTVPTISTDIAADATSNTKTASPKAVKTYVDSKISATYKPAGSVTFANLPALNASVLGNVYNVTDSFTTTSNFVEGAGSSYSSGTNVVVVEASSGVYKFDVLAGFVDLSDYAKTTDFVELTNTEVQAIWDSVFTS